MCCGADSICEPHYAHLVVASESCQFQFCEQVEEEACASHLVEDAVWAAGQLDQTVCAGGSEVPHRASCSCKCEARWHSVFGYTSIHTVKNIYISIG